MNIKELWSLCKSLPHDKDIHKCFDRKATPQSCVDLINQIEQQKAHIERLHSCIYSMCKWRIKHYPFTTGSIFKMAIEEKAVYKRDDLHALEEMALYVRQFNKEHNHD